MESIKIDRVFSTHRIDELLGAMASIAYKQTNGCVPQLMITDLMSDAAYIKGQPIKEGFWWIVRTGGTMKKCESFEVIQRDWMNAIKAYGWALCYINVDRENNNYRLTTYTI